MNAERGTMKKGRPGRFIVHRLWFSIIFALCLCASVAIAQITFSGSVTPSGNVSTQEAETIYEQEDCETGGAVQSPWTTSGARVSCSTEQVKTGTNSIKIHYETSGSGHVGDDQYIVWDKGGTGIFEFYISGWVYFKTPVGLEELGRKIYYICADQNSCADKWSIILGVSDYVTEGLPGDGPMFMSFAQQNFPIGGDTLVSDCGTTDPEPLTGVACNMQYDTWYHVEMYIKSNTLAASPWNGVAKVWITPNGGATEQVYEETWSLNRTTTDYLRKFFVGEQTDVANAPPGSNEDRYWDDVAITNYYRGPTE